MSKTLFEMRFAARLSQEEFAKAIGVAFSTLQRVESGKRRPQFKTMRSIEDGLKQAGLEPAELDWERTFTEGSAALTRQRRQPAA